MPLAHWVAGWSKPFRDRSALQPTTCRSPGMWSVFCRKQIRAKPSGAITGLLFLIFLIFLLLQLPFLPLSRICTVSMSNRKAASPDRPLTKSPEERLRMTVECRHDFGPSNQGTLAWWCVAEPTRTGPCKASTEALRHAADAISPGSSSKTGPVLPGSRGP
ncbi:hypothetical protein BD289DRAFT_266065 [Coniella lustricola]|uniref:Uncharacterized protein n=1 Tax=Coniella lustricola TaxID=2025994 RepID=A0A2T3A7F4_9PEZI|nr:hypothetical protein BD289DRAFT_266065 [Coniella lustricola]